MKKYDRLKWYLEKVDIPKYVKYNYFSKNIVRSHGAFFYPMRGSKIEIDKQAIIEIYGDFNFGHNKVKGSKRETYLILQENAKLIIGGETNLNYGSYLQVQKNAVVSIGTASINTDSVIIAQKEITIGYDVLMGRLVTIFDSDFHPIFDEKGNRTNPPKKVEIGNHVWIGTKSTVLKGTKIKDGAVISANALVGGIIKAKSMYSALPGQSFGTVDWGKRK